MQLEIPEVADQDAVSAFVAGEVLVALHGLVEGVEEVSARTLLLDQQLAWPKYVDALGVPVVPCQTDVLLISGDTAPVLAEDLEELVVEGLCVGDFQEVLPLFLQPVLPPPGESVGAGADLSPRGLGWWWQHGYERRLSE